LELLAREAGLPFKRRVPDAKDWNDQLMTTRVASFPSLTGSKQS
jgi:hypothetical protein